VQSSGQIITTNKPTSSFFTGRMPFLSPNQQCQSTEVKIMYLFNEINIHIQSDVAGLEKSPASLLSS